jgi:hypothetical protein
LKIKALAGLLQLQVPLKQLYLNLTVKVSFYLHNEWLIVITKTKHALVEIQSKVF